jgi:hypothetical protein
MRSDPSLDAFQSKQSDEEFSNIELKIKRIHTSD